MGKYFSYQLPAAVLSYDVSIQTAEQEASYMQQSTISIQSVKPKGWLAAPLLLAEKKNEVWMRTLNNPADRLVAELQQALSGLQFKMQRNGQPETLANHPAVWQQWLILRDKLAYTYTDEWTARMLQKADGTLLHKDLLLQTFLKDLVWQEYFRDVFNTPWDKTEMPGTRTVYGIAGQAGIPLQEKRKLTVTDEGYRFTTTGQWKELRPHPSLISWKKSHDIKMPLSVTYNATYDLSDDHQCAGINATYTVKAGEEYHKSIDLNIVLL